MRVCVYVRVGRGGERSVSKFLFLFLGVGILDGEGSVGSSNMVVFIISCTIIFVGEFFIMLMFKLYFGIWGWIWVFVFLFFWFG